ncbi:gibberellin 2-beta-dioxygenase 2-like [Phoenix dactylifera]|uniref:gibberellin 2beta-dioxygenase n=1 Tax=Phoenix dactylifera TaxID=42345 RepID=A0A8B7BLS3_PHODC|nr:gibberellin 2-beta-dioxygenase 2-like [Phoenix dactylifera]
MVAASLSPVHGDDIKSLALPIVDLSCHRGLVSELIVKACEEFGFFKVINHGVPAAVISQMETIALDFFSLPAAEKQRAGPPNPLGYGNKAIGQSGDSGEVEYLLLHANPSISQRGSTISRMNPTKFSCVVNEYVESMQELAGEILELLGEGLGLADSGVLSRLIRDSESDSLLRLNHYPPCYNNKEDISSDSSNDKDTVRSGRIGFGEHSDPQIITLLRSNGVGGLQILSPSSSDGAAWVPVPPDPTTFYIMVGDLLQAMTNGRLVSVRHRAMVNSYSSRLSMVYFGAPPLHEWISPLPEMITPQMPRCYRSFTWAEYKRAMYSLRLGHNRLDHFRQDTMEEYPWLVK